MKRVPPHDPLDDLIAAALHGDLSPDERAQFESRLQNEPNAQAAYQEAKAMHDLLEQTNRSAQPDPDFEQRMVSGVRRKLANPPHIETAWESLLVLWNVIRSAGRATRHFFAIKKTPSPVWRYGMNFAVLGFIVLIFLGVALGPITSGIKKAKQSAGVQEGHVIAMAEYQTQLDAGDTKAVPKAVMATPDGRIVEYSETDGTKTETDITDKVKEFAKTGVLPVVSSGKAISGGNLPALEKAQRMPDAPGSSPATGTDSGFASGDFAAAQQPMPGAPASLDSARTINGWYSAPLPRAQNLAQESAGRFAPPSDTTASVPSALPAPAPEINEALVPPAPVAAAQPPVDVAENAAPASPSSDAQKAALQSQVMGRMLDKLSVVQELQEHESKVKSDLAAADADKKVPGGAPQGGAVAAEKPAPADNRKLIRNGQLDLVVKSYQAAFDQVTALTKAAGGYVDTSSSQRGGNGKLQGTVVVKILPENLDAFLLKLHDLGDVQNESVSTEDVTKDYFDTQARIVNSQKMEEQLQELLKRENGKVSDLLAVEHELARVRGDIEQMQGQLKLYDFQVQFATVTMNIAEKDLNETAAYVLKEQDNFSLFAVDVEGAYEKARAAADKYNGQVLAANLDHQGDGANQVGASLVVMVAPDQIEPFLADIRGLGRVANFTRETERVAKDGGDSSQPADQTKTEKDKVRVQLAIRSDNDSRKQVALVVVTKGVDQALEDAKAAALSNPGTEILGSALNTTPEGSSTAQISVRVPGKEYTTLMDAFRALGRQASIRVQRNDNNGPGSNGDDVPVIVTLALTDNDTPVQETDLVISATDVDAQAQFVKKQAADSGVEIKSSTFQRQPDGSELAQMTLRLPLAKYPAFLETLKKAGDVNSLSVQRDDRPDEARSDDAAPAEIRLQLRTHYQIVAEDTGVWATLRNNFGAGVTTLLNCLTVIGVIIAFIAPWLVALVLVAWIGRRIYIWRRR